MLRKESIYIVCFLICSVFFANQTAFANYSRFQTSQNFLADRYVRTELYFGTDKPDGGKVTDEDWDKFLESDVTPRFPDGFTVLEGSGQYKDESGKIVKEKSRVLILLYPKKTRRENHEKIEQIRAVYIKLFQQESVLRMDFRQSVEVFF
jgi:hypothetical protein